MSIHYSLWARNTYERPGKWLCKGRKSKKYHKNGWIWCMLASLWLLYATFNGFHVFSSLQVTNVDWKHVSSMSLYSWSILIRPSCDSVKPPSSPNKTHHVTTGLTKIRVDLHKSHWEWEIGKKKNFCKITILSTPKNFPLFFFLLGRIVFQDVPHKFI